MGAAEMKYAIVIERAGSSYSAYVPDLPGCIATGATVEETRKTIAEAVAFHLEGMREGGEAIPPATTICEYLAVA
jgi:predicted RNase H-like HicB family nuclease